MRVSNSCTPLPSITTCIKIPPLVDVQGKSVDHTPFMNDARYNKCSTALSRTERMHAKPETQQIAQVHSTPNQLQGLAPPPLSLPTIQHSQEPLSYALRAQTPYHPSFSFEWHGSALGDWSRDVPGSYGR